MSVSVLSHAPDLFSAQARSRTRRLCDLDAATAAELLKRLNPWDVSTLRPDGNGILAFQGGGRRVRSHNPEIAIITDTEPTKLAYPNGWFYDGGRLRSHRPDLDEVSMFKTEGGSWWSCAKYCTLFKSVSVVEGYELRASDAVWLLGVLNPGASVSISRSVIISDANPRSLIYPEGWEYRDGELCNNPPCDEAASVAMPILNPDQLPWGKDDSA